MGPQCHFVVEVLLILFCFIQDISAILSLLQSTGTFNKLISASYGSFSLSFEFYLSAYPFRMHPTLCGIS